MSHITQPDVVVSACGEENRRFLASDAGQELIAAAVNHVRIENMAMHLLAVARGDIPAGKIPEELSKKFHAEFSEMLANEIAEVRRKQLLPGHFNSATPPAENVKESK
jgi:hypothetical protein